MDYGQAKKRVEAVKGYYIHLAMYLAVIGFLFAVDYFGGGGWWFYWPMAGWGIAVVIHTIVMIFDVQLFGKDWEERKINELMHRSGKA